MTDVTSKSRHHTPIRHYEDYSRRPLRLQEAREIEQKLANAISRAALAMVIDLSLVSFITSVGIHSLVAAARAQAARGGRVVLVRPTLMAVRVLAISGIDKMVPVYDDPEAACRALRDAR
jgi:anti-anti-sigma factor